MGKPADLTDIQKSVIDTLHKEGKPIKTIAEEDGCSQISVSKHTNRKLSGRKNCGHSNKQYLVQNLGELPKEWTEAGITASRAVTDKF